VSHEQLDKAKMSDFSSHFSDRAIQIIADNKIRAAIDAGEFNNLSGLGKPAAIFDEPYDPHWWIRRKLTREQLTKGIDPTRMLK
jgi:hypothetical protein